VKGKGIQVRTSFYRKEEKGRKNTDYSRRNRETVRVRFAVTGEKHEKESGYIPPFHKKGRSSNPSEKLFSIEKRKGGRKSRRLGSCRERSTPTVNCSSPIPTKNESESRDRRRHLTEGGGRGSSIPRRRKGEKRVYFTGEGSQEKGELNSDSQQR